MLSELIVEDLGIITRTELVFGAGMTALTGETGAGKTLLVTALDLLVGGRADPTLVRAGADEAVVEGRFVADDTERVLRRVVPRDGRSRAYVDGRLATASTLAEIGRELVDLHGQHSHQSLLAAASQRDALDRFGGIDTTAYRQARAEVRRLDEALAELGGDERARARELDLVRFQLSEIEQAGLVDAAEDVALAAEEDRLADAVAHQEAAASALHLLGTDDAGRALGAGLAALDGRAPFAELQQRLQGVVAELDDLVSDLRAAGEAIEPDPERLATVRQRRQLLVELRRKYGDTIAEVMAFGRELAERVEDLELHDERAAALDAERVAADKARVEAAAVLGRQRRAAAPELASAAVARLRQLAMPNADLVVQVGADPGDEVTIELAANPGSPPLPLAKVASGGELARTMLAIRLVTTEAPPTLMFDEVDSGVGGSAAQAVGVALGELGDRHQVLAVTHLAQVAACAHHQIAVTKTVTGEQTVASAREVDGDDRITEISRMLSGESHLDAARDHARDLLDAARR